MAAILCDFEDGASPTSDSATDVSEDSVEVKVQPVSMPVTPARRNKRKSSEPRKIKDVADAKQRHWEHCSDVESGGELDILPQGARCRLKLLKEDRRALRHGAKTGDLVAENRKSVQVYVHSRASISKRRTREVINNDTSDCNNPNQEEDTDTDRRAFHRPPSTTPSVDSACDSSEKNNFLLNLPFDVRNILGPSAESLLHQSRFAGLSDFDLDGDGTSQQVGAPNPSSPSSSQAGDGGDEQAHGSSFDLAGGSGESCKQKQRNYKNMTRERRIEANARERTRVHTISAAFENLRRAVPSYSCHQKLSKLAILRIACSYILALATLNDSDYSSQQDCPSFAECVELCTKTIQAEGKARKRKD